MLIKKFLLTDIIDGTPTPIVSVVEGSQFGTNPFNRGEGLVNDGTHLFHFDRSITWCEITRAPLSLTALDFAVVPSDGMAGSSADKFLPDSFFQDSTQARGVFMTFVPYSPPAVAVANTSGQVIW